MSCLPTSRPLPLVLALALALSSPAFAVEAPPAASPAQKSFNIAPGPLEQVLARFAAAAGLALSFDPVLVANRQSPGIQGQHGGEDGLRQLLEGSGLALQAQGDGGYTLRQLPPPSPVPKDATDMPLPVVRVSAPADSPDLATEGSAADGYRVRRVSALGVLGRKALLDTPFSISVVPQALLENIQAQSPDDVYKLNPALRTNTPQSSGWAPNTRIRGFQSYDTAEDGLRRPYNQVAVIEDKERIEVLSGLSGFLYGAAAPGGMVNYVLKRPTVERLNSLTVGNYGGSQAYVHGDFGGRLDAAGTAGYRVNVVSQNGETAVDDQHIRRQLLSAAFEWQPTERLLLELNTGYNHYYTRGPTAYWYFSVPHGPAPDASQLWSQPWLEDEFKNSKLMARATYQWNDRVSLRVAYRREGIDRTLQDHAVNVVNVPGEFEQLRIRSGRVRDTFEALSALADVSFETGPVAHKLTAGYTMFADKFWGTTYSPNTGWQGPYPMGAPTSVPEPPFPADNSSPYYASNDLNRNLVIGDTLTFNPQWSAILGITRSRIISQAFDSSGVRARDDYDKARNSPSLSLLYKPMPWLTTYGSYIEGLELGGTAPDEAANAGANLPPMLSKQKEVGLKAEIGAVLWTGAVFEIEKAYEYTGADNIYAQKGRQNHRGVEFSGTGKPFDRVTLVAGATLLRTAVKGGDFNGKEPNNVAKVLVKAYGEYELPGLPGLSLTGGLYYTGEQWADELNTDRLPAYTTADLGARYATRLGGRPLTLRLNVNNLANKNYWMNSYYVGTPRSVAFSAQMQF